MLFLVIVIVRIILAQSAQYLNDGGLLFCEVGNSEVHVKALYPSVPFTWLSFERGGHGVFMLTKSQLVEFINISSKQYNTLHATDSTIYNELNEVIQYESANSADPEMLGLAKAIGIEKGKPFKPDERMQGILTEAANLANAAFRGVMYKPRSPEVYFYPDRKWYSPLANGSHEFLDKNGARVLDDRIGFHFYATEIEHF